MREIAKRVFGVLILFVVISFLFFLTCVGNGLLDALIAWGISIALVFLIIAGTWLLVS